MVDPEVTVLIPIPIQCMLSLQGMPTLARSIHLFLLAKCLRAELLLRQRNCKPFELGLTPAQQTIKEYFI